MKKFIIKVLLFFSICTILDVMVGYVSSSLQKSSKGGLTQKDEYIKSEMDADILIMGSSRASHHYISTLMADSLGCSVYNAGMDGMGIIMNYGVLLEITKRYNPQIIIYELTPAFDWIYGDNDKYLVHLRHAYDIIGIDSIFWDVNANERLKMLSNSYRSNSLVPHLIYDNIIANKDTLNGYIPLFGKYKSIETKNISEDDVKKDDNKDFLKLEYLQKLINLCKAKNIKLIFATSPVYKNDSYEYKFGEDLAKKNDIPFIDYQKMNVSFDDEKIFQDKHHLNNEGAMIYSAQVIDYIKQVIRTK